MTDVLPPALRKTIGRLAREEQRAASEQARSRLRQRRENLLERYGFTSRIREDDDGETLICYPTEWVDDGTVNLNAIEDLDRAWELRLSGTGDPDEWSRVATRNRELAARIEERHGPIHGVNARAFATFMSNHRIRTVDTASPADVYEFLTSYYIRNVWPSEEETTEVSTSIDILLQTARSQSDD